MVSDEYFKNGPNFGLKRAEVVEESIKDEHDTLEGSLSNPKEGVITAEDARKLSRSSNITARVIYSSLHDFYKIDDDIKNSAADHNHSLTICFPNGILTEEQVNMLMKNYSNRGFNVRRLYYYSDGSNVFDLMVSW